MHDPRTSTALRQLADLDLDPHLPVWDWAVVRLESCGRLRLPVEARAALGAGALGGDLRGVCHRDVLGLSAARGGRPMPIDGRGRLYVPAWLRQRSVPWLLIGANPADSTVVVAPTSVLDSLGNQLLGDVR